MNCAGPYPEGRWRPTYSWSSASVLLFVLVLVIVLVVVRVRGFQRHVVLSMETTRTTSAGGSRAACS
jgi:hypothetical protein